MANPPPSQPPGGYNPPPPGPPDAAYPPPQNGPPPPGYGGYSTGPAPPPGQGYGPPPYPGSAPPPPGFNPGYGASPFQAPPNSAPPFQAPPPAGYGPPTAGFGPPPHQPPVFFIRSEMHGKVLDINGCDNRPGARLIMWPKKSPPENNQLWYMDTAGVLRSKLHDFAIEASSTDVTMQPHSPSNPNQQWTVQGNRIINRSNPEQVLDIKGESTRDGAEVCAWKYKGSKNQHFAMDYV